MLIIGLLDHFSDFAVLAELQDEPEDEPGDEEEKEDEEDEESEDPASMQIYVPFASVNDEDC